MKTISVMNIKGGVAKTTTAVNTAEILASEYGYRVLLIDADAQADATAMLCGPDEDGVRSGCGLYGAMVFGGCINEYIDETKHRKLDIMTASSDLFYIGMETAEKATKSMADILAAAEQDYDFCIIDCPPSFSAPSVAAICNSTDVVIPVKLDAFGIRGCQFLIDQIEAINAYNPDIRVAGILVTMWHNSDVCRQSKQLVSDRFGDCMLFPTVIRRTDKVDESTFYGQALTEYSKYSSAGRDYRQFVNELLRVVMDGEEARDDGV